MGESKAGLNPDTIDFNFRQVTSAGQGEGDNPGGLGLNGGLHLVHNAQVVVSRVVGLINMCGEVESN